MFSGLQKASSFVKYLKKRASFFEKLASFLHTVVNEKASSLWKLARFLVKIHLLSHVFEHWLWWYRYFWSKVNIWNVNCARATTFIFNTWTGVVKVSKFLRQKMSRPEGLLWKCQSFWDRKCLDPRGTRTPNLRIHAECSYLLSYQGQAFDKDRGNIDEILKPQMTPHISPSRASHDDVIKWKHFPRNWPFVRGIHRSRWIPHIKASDAELWCFLWSASG